MNALETSIHQFFGLANENDSKLVASLFKTETIAKGEFYQKAGRYCNRFSYVENGLIRVYLNMSDKEITQWICPPGYFITDLSSFLFKATSKWNMQALTDCTLYTVQYEDYLALNKAIPKWTEFEKMFIYNCFITMENRILSLISLSSEERYNLLFQQQPELFNQVPLQYLASMIGMTPETFSRIRAKKIAGV